MRNILFLSLLLLTACGATRVATPDAAEVIPPGEVHQANELRDYSDLDRLNGKKVIIEGTFTHIKGVHGVVTMNNRMKILLPNFDHFARGHAWFDFVGRRVQAIGILQSYTRPIEGFEGPSLKINGFSEIEAVDSGN